MAKSIESIIGKEDARNLRSEFNDLLLGGANYDDIEELLLGYGLEMDFIEQLLW
jgi:hypothetical protein